MKRGYWIALVLAAGVWAASQARAQAPASGAGSTQSGQAQKPAQPQQAAPPAEANPFPEDTSNVPVMPSNGAAALPAETYSGSDNGAIPMAGDDRDPVRSPDDPAPSPSSSGSQGQESSSLSGTDQWQPPADDDDSGKKSGRGRMTVKEPTHQESAAEDINVGGYYLDKKNWRAAQSRFQSAMVLDPENPDVYWGLAEAARHLGDFAEARGYYQKLADYDPDSKHGKEAIKALKDPEIANARNAAPGQTSANKAK
jgi:tetratricopeptide (TPR) repeat protein